MCAISGIISLNSQNVQHLEKKIKLMNDMQAHRGPDGEGLWISENRQVGLGHRRLSILDLEAGSQPMADNYGDIVCFNGEIYNFIELKQELSEYQFKTHSDTEVILAAYLKWGVNCLQKFRGMFAFALWDSKNELLFCARDHFGIKPFHYTINDNTFYFSSEAKALLPFLKNLETDLDVLKEYLTFQLILSEKTLFKDVFQLEPAHYLLITKDKIQNKKYWEVEYETDFYHSETYFKDKLDEILEESVKIHLRADVPVGAYISGGIDSSLIATMAKREVSGELAAFTGKFSNEGLKFDESLYAREVTQNLNIKHYEQDITSKDFINHIEKMVYHMDYPQAGPGAFAQYCVSELVGKHRKVALGGQGADEIFGGYTRYLVAYFEQCIKGAIDGTLNNGNFLVTYESIIENLQSLQSYKPMLKDFFSQGLFDSLDKRYYQLINRSPQLHSWVNWKIFSDYDPYESYLNIFNGSNVSGESYFDKMTHFDFKVLLPALLQIEDRVSMAWGIETRVPFVDKRIVEFAATVPANFKFKNGQLKRLLIESARKHLPDSIIQRKNKMGFPVPINQWLKSDIKEFIHDVFSSAQTKTRGYFDASKIIQNLDEGSDYSRNFWGILNLELWHQQFHDKFFEFKKRSAQL